MPPSDRGWGIWIERVLALFVAIALVWAMAYLFRYEQLPQPYFYVAEYSFMDWVNTAHFAHNSGAYDSWGTVYPPLSFVFLKYLTNPVCYTTATGYFSRACDVYGLVMLHLIYVITIFLVAKSFMKIDRSTALPRSFALCAGYPLTFALERGNIVLLCFTCVLLAYGPLLRSARLRWIFAAFAINMKVYLIGSLFAQLLLRRWRWFEGEALMTVLVYLISYAIMGAGTPVEIYANIKLFAESTVATTPIDLWNPITYRPAISLLNGPFPVSNWIGSWWTELLSVVLPNTIYAVQAFIALAALATVMRPAVVSQQRIVFLSFAMALVTSEAGSYTQAFLIVFVFMEPWRGFGRKWAILGCYALCIPSDLFTVYDVPSSVTSSFMGKREIITEYSVGIMPFIRPGIVLSIAFAMALVTIRDVWDDARAHGWQSPLPWRRLPEPAR